MEKSWPNLPRSHSIGPGEREHRLDLAVARGRLQLGDDLLQDRRERLLGQGQIEAAAQPAAGEVEDVVDQRRHAADAALHQEQHVAVDAAGRLALQQLGAGRRCKRSTARRSPVRRRRSPCR